MPAPHQPADFASSFMDDYFAECEEHLHVVRAGLLTLEASIGGDAPAGAVEELFRSFHSLKGISAMVELREAERLAHEMESCLRAIGTGELPVAAPALDALVDGVHALEQVIAARRGENRMPSIVEAMRRLTDIAAASHPALSPPALAKSMTAPEPAVPVWRVTFTPTAALVARGIKVDTIRGRLAEYGHIQTVAPRVTAGGIAFDFVIASDQGDVLASWEDDGVTVELLPAATDGRIATVPLPATLDDAPDSSSTARPADSPAPTNFVRVDLGRLDDLMRLVGDLVVSRARLEDTLQRVETFMPSTEWRTLQEHSASIERHLRDLREGVMRVRLVPVGEIFRRMPFVVRDLARDSGKRLRLDLAGQATEIDKFLIERMMDPVLHLVRNAVSHGIEDPAERARAGKPPEGTIKLSASTIGESVLLEVTDDGRGLDVAAISRRARDRGLSIQDGLLDARELLDVICAPGFSTREAADRVSGRGVGMSVVRDTIQDLGGTLSVETTPAKGTTFRMTLPLTLAITDALIVHAGDRTFAVPQSAISEVADVESRTIRRLENNELVPHRDEALPVVRLVRLFAIAETPRQRFHMIVVRSGSTAVGILVDRIVGQREIVVKTLKDPLIKVTGVSGATELGDGRLVLILDPVALTRSVRGRSALGVVH